MGLAAKTIRHKHTLEVQNARDQSNRPENLVIGLVTSILLHLVLLIGANNWLRIFSPEYKRELSQPIPIEYIEVPANEIKPSPKTKRRAANNSVAGGKAKLKRPVAAAKSLSSTKSRLVASPKNSPAPKPVEPKLPKMVVPTPSRPQPQPSVQQPQETPTSELVSKLRSQPQTTAVAPTLPKPQPQPQETPTSELVSKLRSPAQTTKVVPTPPKPQETQASELISKLRSPSPATKVTPSDSKPQPQNTQPSRMIAKLRSPSPATKVTPSDSKPQPQNTQPSRMIAKLRSPSPATKVTPPRPKPPIEPQKTKIAPTMPTPQALTRSQKNNLSTPKSASEQLQTRATPQKQSPQPSQKTSGAASRLGGPVSLASRNFGSNEQAFEPNSNRSNRGTQGIDASRDVDLGSYLNQLRQQVKQQWIPGVTEDSWRTVVFFVVSRSGQASNVRILQPSGSNVTDEAAINAIKRAAPFAPLPAGYTEEYLNIQFTFNINVYGQLELQGR